MTLWDDKDIGSHYQGWWGRQQQHTNELHFFLKILYSFFFVDSLLLAAKCYGIIVGK